MTRPCTLLLSALLSAPMFAAEPAAPRPVPNDEQDLVFFQAARPYRLRLHLQIGNQAYQTQWSDILRQLFQYLDQDQNGLLDAKELAHAPHPLQLRQLIQGVPELEAMPPPELKELVDAPSTAATLEQFRAYYRRHGVAPWQAEWASRSSKDDFLDRELFRLIGKAGADSLTVAELQDAATRVMRLDTDFDELITLPELAPNRGYPAFHMVPAVPPEAPFLFIDPSEKGRKLFAERLRQQYDSDRDGKLSQREIALDGVLFSALDGNRDGFLQDAELVRWLDQPPDLELLVRLDGPANEPVYLLTDRRAQPNSLASMTHVTRIGAAVVRFRAAQLEVIRIDGAAQLQSLRQLNLKQFRALDANRDGVLDGKEIFQPPFAFVPILRLADRNGDDKLIEKEFLAFLDLQQKLVTRTMSLTLVNRGASFYDLVDADRDRRLSQRELRTLAQRLAPWLEPKTKVLGREQIPQQFQLIVSHGVLRPPDADPGSGSVIRPEARLRGPLWFRKLDRNADGDVSRAEFLGTAAQFRKLDRDGDGLIDLEEAEAADKARKK